MHGRRPGGRRPAGVVLAVAVAVAHEGPAERLRVRLARPSERREVEGVDLVAAVVRVAAAVHPELAARAVEGAAVPGAQHGGRAVALDLVARSEEHTSELQSLMRISYTVSYLNKQKR